MRLTAAEPSPRNRRVRRIYLDDDYAFSMPEELYLRLHLYEKETLTEEEVEHLRGKVFCQAAREAAIRYLSCRDRTAKGLFERLQRAGYDEPAARAAVEEMTTIGYVDDRRYAQRYVSELQRTKALSRKAMRLALQARGLESELIDEVIAESAHDEEEAALRGVKKKFGKYDLSEPAVHKKAVAFLMHRGFSYEVVRRILRELNAGD